MSSISGVTSYASQISNLTTSTGAAAPPPPPKGPPPHGARPPGGGKAAFNSALEELLGKSDDTTALEQKIQDSVDQVLKNGGTMDDVKSTVESVLKEAGVDSQKLQQLMRPPGADPSASGSGSNATATDQSLASKWQVGASSSLTNMLLPSLDQQA